MRLLYPQIDWRGSGPGYVESELPFLPYLMAVAYEWTGIDERVGRYLSALATALALAAFMALARDRLSDRGAIAATLFFALNPLIMTLATALQPEPWLLLGYVCSILYFTRWIDGGGRWNFYLAAFFTGFAILAKANGLILGLLFLPMVVSKRGKSALKDPRLWFFALLSLTLPALWYVHAHNFWSAYGNSLGMSNEVHWVGFDLLRRPAFFLGLARSEITYVWLPTGVALVLLGFLARTPLLQLEIFWMTALAIYYFVTARTSADDWAYYYHVLTVPLAALMIGHGMQTLARNGSNKAAFVSAMLAIPAAGAAYLTVKGLSREALIGASTGVLLAIAAMISMYTAKALPEDFGRGRLTHPFGTLLASAGAILFAITMFDAARRDVRTIQHRRPHPYLQCAKSFAPYVPKTAQLLVSGGPCHDESGQRVAYNSSYMFYWMDRKGTNICLEDQSVEAVIKASRRGADFYIAEAKAMDTKQGFENELRSAFTVKAECPGMVLFRLSQ